MRNKNVQDNRLPSRTAVNYLDNTKVMELNLGNPKNGWIPITFKSTDFELEFIASNIPENPIDKLCESLILLLNGIATEFCWNLEPEYYFFSLDPKEKQINLIISKNSKTSETPNPIFELIGDFKSIILPMYRSLKKFNTLEFNKTDWTKIDQTKLDKLTELITQRKNG